MQHNRDQSRPRQGGRGTPSKGTLLTNLLRSQTRLGLLLIAFSGGITLLTLSLALFMLQVYDRVLSSRSKDTLFFLTLAVVCAIGLSAVLDATRQQVANRVGTWLSHRVGPTLLAETLEKRLLIPSMRVEALRELMTVRSFISTPAVFNLVDMLWIPLYLSFTFMLHPVVGIIALLGAVVLFSLALFNEKLTRSMVRGAQTQGQVNMQFAEGLIRNSEVIDSMGMADDLVRHWSKGYIEEISSLDAAQALSARILAASKFVRYLIQVALLGAGALLVLDLQLTAGAMVAGSIIVARLLSPIESSIGYWKQFVLARQSFEKLQEFLQLPPQRLSAMCLPKPDGQISVSKLSYVAPGGGAAILQGLSFGLSPGEMLAIVGPSASGKTTLARQIVGVIRPSAGCVRLDGADTFEWKRADLGPNVGYLPQDIELLPGSIRSNISRFRPHADDESIVMAAKLADCHDMILGLASGYDTMLRDGGRQLSGGQRQRLALARALFGAPKLVVLDEPNSSLDANGERALLRTLAELKRRQVTAIVVAHSASMVKLADKLLVLQDGRVANFGPAPQVLAEIEALRGQPTAKPGPVRRPSRPEQLIPAQQEATHERGAPA